jgi:hypothetical protein
MQMTTASTTSNDLADLHQETAEPHQQALGYPDVPHLATLSRGVRRGARIAVK